MTKWERDRLSQVIVLMSPDRSVSTLDSILKDEEQKRHQEVDLKRVISDNSAGLLRGALPGYEMWNAAPTAGLEALSPGEPDKFVLQFSRTVLVPINVALCFRSYKPPRQ